jgi:hypothetical protein
MTMIRRCTNTFTLEGKKRQKKTIQKSTTFHKDRVFTKSASSLTGLQATSERIHYKRKKRLQGKSKVYATSAAGSAAEEGTGEVAPSLGGGIDALVIGVEEIVVEVEEATEGVIIDTMPSVYFFAFSKKPRSSERGRPWEELTFSQSTSSPCA